MQPGLKGGSKRGRQIRHIGIPLRLVAGLGAWLIMPVLGARVRGLRLIGSGLTQGNRVC